MNIEEKVKNRYWISKYLLSLLFRVSILEKEIESTPAVNLQSAYEGSSNPQITTDDEIGSLKVKTGATLASDFVLEVQNSIGATVFSVAGTGSTVANTIRTQGFQVISLNSLVPFNGDRAYVVDALSPTYLAPVVGGGTVKVPVFFNGVTWVVG